MTQSQSTLIGLHSEWVGQSQMRVRIRRIDGPHSKLLVDVTELTSDRTSKRRSLDTAKKYAQLNGASKSFTELCDFQTDRKAIRLNGDEQKPTHVRLVTWSFEMEDK
jgi:hypothetical protein